MSFKLYVGNLAYSATDQSLTDLFSQAGVVESARIITDRDSGRSKGFGFVEMSNSDEGNEAINRFNGTEIDGRQIKVSEAKPQEPRRDNFRRNGGGGGAGGGSRGGFGRQRY